MAMGNCTQRRRQEAMWIAHHTLARGPSHPFYERLNQLLEGNHFDDFVEGLCRRFYAEKQGRPSLAPGIYFRLLLIGYFEGIDSERGIAWRAQDSLALRSFLDIALDESSPDHSTLSRTRRLVDVETEAVVAVTVQVADRGDTQTVQETLCEAGEQVATVAGEAKSEGVNPQGPKEIVLDKGYHSSEVLVKLAEWEVRSYCSEPERGRRSWKGKAEEQAAVYANRRRIRGERGKRLLRQRGEKIERSFAHLYETGGMRRVYLRRHPNILKRLLVHVAAFNLGLVMRKLFGKGTPRGLQGYRAALFLAILRRLSEVWALRRTVENFMMAPRRSPLIRALNLDSFDYCERGRFYHGLLGPRTIQ